MEYHQLPAERCRGGARNVLRSRDYEVTVTPAPSAATTTGNLWARKHD